MGALLLIQMEGNWSLSHSGRADRNLNMLFSMTSFQACGKIACIIHAAASPFPSPQFISKDNLCKPRRFHHHFFSSSVNAFFPSLPFSYSFFISPLSRPLLSSYSSSTVSCPPTSISAFSLPVPRLCIPPSRSAFSVRSSLLLSEETLPSTVPRLHPPIQLLSSSPTELWQSEAENLCFVSLHIGRLTRGSAGKGHKEALCEHVWILDFEVLDFSHLCFTESGREGPGLLTRSWVNHQGVVFERKMKKKNQQNTNAITV